MKNNKYKPKNNTLLEIIKNKSGYIKIPTIDDKNYIQKKININTDVDIVIKKFHNNLFNGQFELKKNLLKNEPIKTIKYELFPTDNQKIILQNWFLGYIDMYNLIIKKIKDEYKKQLKKNKKLRIIDLQIDLNINNLKKEYAENKLKLNKIYVCMSLNNVCNINVI